jgi:histidinol-phosphate/aromatic aminotransferase/cobyric acid decarboxylase-like protein/choline kinase
MQAIILAAGMGRRLGPITEDKPKAMVEVNGKALIERMFESLKLAGIRRVIIVTGHRAATLKDFATKRNHGLEIIFVDNSQYETTNNIYSLWLARHYLESSDTLLLESDIIFEPEIIDEVVNNPNPNLAIVARFEPWMDGTVTILDANDNIIDMLPKSLFRWANVESYYKTVNIYKFSSEFSRRFYVPFLEAYIASFGDSKYYEQALTIITFLSKTELKAMRLDGRKWYEIDDANDLAIAETLFAEGEEALTRYQRLYGGYWRFPRLRDFCYLVNPYFPSERMTEEFKSNLGVLVSSYPSGFDSQSRLAARVFHCDPSQVLVGNGASELIRVVLSSGNWRIGIVAPTFEEYLMSDRWGGSVGVYYAPPPDFHYGIEELTELAKGLDALVLINPDNPSGHFIGQWQLVRIIERLGAAGVRLILDESFVDFADEPDGASMLRGDVLRRYPSLTVIRSISKSFGVPGLRLGVLASGDEQFISQIKQRLPIWNINSLAEYFLQVCGKYKDDYGDACERLRNERQRFLSALARIPFLRPVPSQANYFLCEVKEGLSATRLTHHLLENHGVLIKDCTGKRGLEHGQYVRIAIRGESDNDFLLSALKDAHHRGLFSKR